MAGCTGASNTKRLKKVIYKSVRLCIGLELESPSHMPHLTQKQVQQTTHSTAMYQRALQEIPPSFVLLFFNFFS